MNTIIISKDPFVFTKSNAIIELVIQNYLLNDVCKIVSEYIGLYICLRKFDELQSICYDASLLYELLDLIRIKDIYTPRRIIIQFIRPESFIELHFFYVSKKFNIKTIQAYHNHEFDLIIRKRENYLQDNDIDNIIIDFLNKCFEDRYFVAPDHDFHNFDQCLKTHFAGEIVKHIYRSI